MREAAQISLGKNFLRWTNAQTQTAQNPPPSLASQNYNKKKKKGVSSETEKKM
jgi:hypothetical protein